MKKNFLKIFTIFVALFIRNVTVSAASFSVSANNMTKGTGGYLTIKGNDVTGRFDIRTSNSSIVSIDEDRAWIENNSYRIRLNALNVGTATITVIPNGVSDSNGNTVSLSSKTIRITVSLPREKSDDNNLKSLAVEGYELSPEFSKDVQAYKTVIPEGTKKINIKAVANESHAKVSGTGEVEVSDGVNMLNVVVKSEKGTEKIYTINVEVKDKNPINVNIGNKEYTVVKIEENLIKPDFFEKTTADVKGYQVPAFINKNTNIKLVGLKDSEGNISLYKYDLGEFNKYNPIILNNDTIIPIPFTKNLDLIKTSVTINNEKYDAYKYSEDSKFVVINATNLADGKTDLYLYDTVNKTAQKFDETFINDTKETIKNYTYIIIAFAGALFLMLIIIFSLLHSLKRKQKKLNKFLQKQEAKIEATRKLNDVVEEVKKITEAENKNKNAKEKKKDKQKTKKESKKEETKAEENKKEIEVKEITVKNNKITEVSEDTEEIYDLFADDKKSKKKKKK